MKHVEIDQSHLELLTPLAVVIACGCEPCARLMVERALEGGCSMREIKKLLGIVEHMSGLDCLAQNVGSEVLARMEKPLAMARATLRQHVAAQ